MTAVILALYVLLLSLLFIYGINQIYLTLLTLRHSAPDSAAPPLADSAWPSVTVQVPIYNERHVAVRIIDAVCALDYPRDRLEIQILDDSTDHTAALVAKCVAQWQARGLDIKQVQRPTREGYKAGALAHGLTLAHGTLIAIFDADFVPPRDFLRRTVPHFADEAVGFVQTRWGHLNAEFSILTRLQSISIDAHFTVEQFARQRGGLPMNFNGTAGAWRRACIETAGGWLARTVTEDLDLSYRAQIAGWKPVYLRDVIAPGEVPATVSGYRRQQYRWARGSIETARLLLPHVWRADFNLRQKIMATLHLTGYSIQLWMVLASLLLPLVVITVTPDMLWFLRLTTVFMLTFYAPMIYFLVGQHEAGKLTWRRVPQIILMTLLGADVMYNNARAVLMGLFARRTMAFERTPKFGALVQRNGWARSPYHLAVSGALIIELVMLVYNLNTLRLAILYEAWAFAFFALLFATRLIFTLSLALRQQWLTLRQPMQVGQTQPDV
ncbi:MAG: glycosyltransferase [Chloroflexi bacterium]|nr:glycosyltransferase [Chloroflexota bacterium]